MLEYMNTGDDFLASEKFDMTIFELQSEISKTLAHPLRLAILHLLKDGEKTVTELSQTTTANQSNISQHLAILRQRQIVKTRKVGSTVYYSVSSPKISQACNMVREVLIEQLTQQQQIAKNYTP
jgi:ArsR family transcriptional regulator